MRNIAITQSRREASQLRWALYYGPCGPDQVDASQDVVVELKETIALSRKLTTFDRRVLEHMCLDGLNYDETAQRTGRPVGTIKSRLSRARQRMRDAVMNVEIDGAAAGARRGSAIDPDAQTRRAG